MPRKKREPLTFVQQMKRIHESMIEADGGIRPIDKVDDDEYESIDIRIKKLLKINENAQKQKRNDRMLFFVMYDIQNNKVRNLVNKYLIRNGCTRIQRSIFIADTPIETCNRIKADLAEVQETYDNDDSIIILPVSSDYLKMMKVIGQQIDLDIITHSCNTLFF